MPEFLTEISNSATSWGRNTIGVESNKPVELFIKVTPGNADMIKLSVPYLGEGVAIDKAITSKSNWDNPDKTGLTLVPMQKGITIRKITKTKPKGFAIDLKSQKYNELILKFTLTTIDADFAEATLGVIYEVENNEIGSGSLIVAIAKSPVKPAITSFTTSNGALPVNGSFTLNWRVTDAKKLEMMTDPRIEQALIKEGQTAMDCELSNTKITYTLKATNAFGSDEKSVTIWGTPSPGVGRFKPFDGGRGQLLNLFKHADKLYALVLSPGTELEKENVWLWVTEDGANWRRTAIAFMSGKVDDTQVPLEFAGSPSVLYNDCIYLIGGSRFDVNCRSNEMYYCDFKTGWKRVGENMDKRFGKCMGHALVVVKNAPGDVGEIWLIGGHGAKGCQSDIYVYNLTGNSWSKDANVKLPKPLCMHSVIQINGQLQIFGGFSDTPGYPDRFLKDADVYTIDSKQWSKIWSSESSTTREHNWYIMSVAVAVYNGYRMIFGLFLDGTTTIHKTLRIQGALSFEDVSRDNYMLPDFFTSVQAVDFNKAVWLSVVENEGKLKSNDLWYFVQIQPNDNV